jgi:hypothetical protein
MFYELVNPEFSGDFTDGIFDDLEINEGDFGRGLSSSTSSG